LIYRIFLFIHIGFVSKIKTKRESFETTHVVELSIYFLEFSVYSNIFLYTSS
jgi:hypothetical protein